MFKIPKRKKYNSAINLIYDRNICTLRRKVKILIVDDDEFELTDMLKERKYDIYYKKDITYAIEAEPFDIIVIDIIGIAQALRSNMEGFAIARDIKTKYPAKQVWCYSGSIVKAEISEKLCEIDGYISKDTDLDKWAEKLDRIIEEYSSEEYQEKVLRKQLIKYRFDSDDIDKIMEEYKKSRKEKNFNSVIDILSSLTANGACILETISLILNFAKLFAQS